MHLYRSLLLPGEPPSLDVFASAHLCTGDTALEQVQAVPAAAHSPANKKPQIFGSQSAMATPREQTSRPSYSRSSNKTNQPAAFASALTIRSSQQKNHEKPFSKEPFLPLCSLCGEPRTDAAGTCFWLDHKACKTRDRVPESGHDSCEKCARGPQIPTQK